MPRDRASRFERLLGDLEKLVAEESHALQEGDLDRAESILGRKGPIVDGLVDPDGGREEATAEQQNRLRELSTSMQHNAQLLSQRRESVRADLSILGRRRKKARGVQRAYKINTSKPRNTHA